MSDDPLADLLASIDRGVLVTLRPDGRPQLSNVNHTFDPDTGLIRISVTDNRAKVRNLRRDPRVSYHVTSADFGRYAVADGTAEFSAVATDRADAAVEELIDVYRAIRGEHPDWADYRSAMVRDHRLVLRIAVERIYGQG